MSDLEKVTIVMSAGLAEATFGVHAEYAVCEVCGLYMSHDETTEVPAPERGAVYPYAVVCGNTCQAAYLGQGG